MICERDELQDKCVLLIIISSNWHVFARRMLLCKSMMMYMATALFFVSFLYIKLHTSTHYNTYALYPVEERLHLSSYTVLSLPQVLQSHILFTHCKIMLYLSFE